MKLYGLIKPSQANEVEEKAWLAGYEIVCEWWTAHGFPPVPVEALPSLGVIAADDDLDGKAAGWLYMDNSSTVAMMEWLVVNPNATPKESLTALKTVIEFLKTEAGHMGYKTILTTCRQNGLAKVAEKLGFTRTDEGMIHLIWKDNT